MFAAVALGLCLVSCAVGWETERIKVSKNVDERLWQELEKAEVIYVGETHDDPADHQYELELVRGLLRRKLKFAIGWEMFDETQQGMLDAWASHAISLPEMLQKTDFQKHWGIYSPVYEEILRLAGHANVPNLALNAAPELIRKIARGNPLSAEEKAMLPTGFVATEGGYRNFVALMGEHPGMHGTNERRFFDAQNARDQAMASRILDFKARNPNVRLVVFTGRGHVSGGYGIPFFAGQKSDLQELILLLRDRLDSSPREKRSESIEGKPDQVVLRPPQRAEKPLHGKNCGDRRCGPMNLRQRVGSLFPIPFPNQDSLFAQAAPRRGNRRRVLWRRFANRPLNS